MHQGVESSALSAAPQRSHLGEFQNMFNISRRQALAASGGLIGSLLVPQRFATAAVGSTLNIAYNVNLPSFDPQTGPSSVNPTIQAI
jgi:peptide/nickel transport system substrate-binding protein